AERIRPENTQRTKTFLQAVLEASIDAIITIDEAGTIELCNAAVERMFGYTVSELTGQNVQLLMPSPSSQRQGDENSLASYARGHGLVCISREIKGRRKDGPTFPAELTLSEYQAALRPRYLGVIRDITDRKKAEYSAAESQRRLRTEVAYDLHDT